MTIEEAKKKAEEIVFVNYTLGDIIYYCEFYGIRTHTKNGKVRSRCTLEKALIEKMTKDFCEE